VNLIGNRTDAATLVSDTDVGAALNCLGNQPPPTDAGRPNRVAGPLLGQCAALPEDVPGEQARFASP
jgi:hypothetical protein